MTDDLDALRARLGGEEATDAELQQHLDDAEAICLAYINRAELPTACRPAVRYLAVCLYRRRGLEGELSHAEGSVSISPDPLPELVRVMLRPWRRV